MLRQFPIGLASGLVLLAALALAACSDSEEEVPGDTATATPADMATAPTPTPSAAPTSSTAPTPSPVPSASPDAVPADWKTYSDPSGLFTVRYPSKWFQVGTDLLSFDPATWDKHSPPADSIDIEISAQKDDGYGCGVLTYDSSTGNVSPATGSTPVTLGGVGAWQIIREPGDPLLNDPWTRIQAISAVYRGYCVNIAAYFNQQVPDVDTFGTIAGSFHVTY